MEIDVRKMNFRQIGNIVKESAEKLVLRECCGQRFIAAGTSGKDLEIHGIPGNALGAYLNGGSIEVMSNAQDAVGDTMNDGTIAVHGNIGDAAGYAMRGGKIFVRGNAGYRAGIHMKAYEEKSPLMVIGGSAGSFLGEYQAGGTIVVLNLYAPEKKPVGFFPCTGMHGGKMFLRSDCRDVVFPEQVTVSSAGDEELKELGGYIKEFCTFFDFDEEEIMSGTFTVIKPDTNNPYRRMYVQN